MLSDTIIATFDVYRDDSVNPPYFEYDLVSVTGRPLRDKDGTRLSDADWFEEYLSCAGWEDVLGDSSTKLKEGLHVLTGKMCAERHDSYYGTDYEEYFEVYSLEKIVKVGDHITFQKVED